MQVSGSVTSQLWDYATQFFQINNYYCMNQSLVAYYQSSYTLSFCRLQCVMFLCCSFLVRQVRDVSIVIEQCRNISINISRINFEKVSHWRACTANMLSYGLNLLHIFCGPCILQNLENFKVIQINMNSVCEIKHELVVAHLRKLFLFIFHRFIKMYFMSKKLEGQQFSLDFY